MKRLLTLVLSVGLFSVLFISAEVAHAYEAGSTTITVGQQTHTVNYVSYHPSENLALRVATANNNIGTVAHLSDIAKDHQAVAAINGTFFNAYDANDLQPMGAVMIDRTLQHYRGSIVGIGVSSDGELSFGNANQIKITGGMNDSNVWPNTWYAWFLNHYPSSDDEIVVFTRDFREQHLHIPSFNFVIVENGTVINKTVDEATIPSNGFVIAYGPTETNQIVFDRFIVGKAANYKIDIPDSLAQSAHLISSSPKLITAGKIDIDFERDGARDVKLTTHAGQRSFIGSKQDGTVVFGTVRNVTLNLLAEILLKLGLEEAVNLDGGASSGLYESGKYLTQPGRMLSNALVLVKQERIPKVYINSEEIFFHDATPYIDKGNTMVPVRGVFERLGATLEWDGQTKTVTANRFDVTIKMIQDSKTAYVNGVETKLNIAPTNINGRIYIPLRFVSEDLGAQVEWDGEQYAVSIESDIISAPEHYAMAEQIATLRKEEEEKVAKEIEAMEKGDIEVTIENEEDLEEEEAIQAKEKAKLDLIAEKKKDGERTQEKLTQEMIKHLYIATKINPDYNDAWLKLGVEYAGMRKYDQAVVAYLQVSDERALISLGWAAYSDSQFDVAIEALTKALSYPSLEENAHYVLGHVYRVFSINDIERSNEHFKQALDLIEDKESNRAKEIRERLGL